MIEYINGLPTTWSGTVDGLRVALHHGSPKDFMVGIYPDLKDDEHLRNHIAVELSATVRHGPSESSLTSLVPEDAPTSNALICSSPDRPDLTAAWRGVQREGDTVSGSLVCQNIGLRAARSFKVRVVLSDDQSPDATDTLVLMQTITSLAASAEASPIRIEVSDDHPLEGKYLIAIVDSGSAVTEENEGNNKLVKQIP